MKIKNIDEYLLIRAAFIAIIKLDPEPGSILHNTLNEYSILMEEFDDLYTPIKFKLED